LALGRIYVAREGVNAQMSVPTNVLSSFKRCCLSVPELGSHMENGLNIDPVPVPVSEFFEGGKAPFKGLHVRERRQIVADALDGPLDWQKAGTDLPPLEWHDRLEKAGKEGGDGPIILDCRNEYETGVGHFVGAEPLNTDTFKDTWGKLRERLEGVPKDREIMAYCTGGIRCVKVGAYLEQEMGFKNVSRLAGGIIAYDRAVQEEREGGVEGMESLFHGTNFVFDGRLGRRITEHKVRDRGSVALFHVGVMRR
jgi:predicted sulfurtransferase